MLNRREREELKELQELANAQRNASFTAFLGRLDGAKDDNGDAARDLVDAMERTDAHVDPEDPEHAAARAALLERLRVPELPPTLDRSRRTADIVSAAAADDDSEGLSISSDDSTRVVPAPPPWTIPGRDSPDAAGGREAVSSVGDQLIGQRWAQRLKGQAARRYHVRREGSRFGEPLVPERPPPPPREPMPVPPPDPSADDVAMEEFRLRCFFSDANPEAEFDAAEFIAEAAWTDGLEAAWRKLYKEHAISAMEARILAAPTVAVMKRRLLARLIVLGSIFDRQWDPTQYDEPVARCKSAVDVARLWRKNLLLYDATPQSTKPDPAFEDLRAAPRPPREDGSEEVPEVVEPEPPREPLRPMKMDLTVLIGGLDLTVIFDAPAAKVDSLRMALETDIAEALRPRRREVGASMFDVCCENLSHGALLDATVSVAKDKQVVRDMNQRMVDAVERGTFALKTTRDVLLNHFAMPAHGVVVNGAALIGGSQMPEGFIGRVPEPVAFAPLRYTFETHTATFVPRRLDAEALRQQQANRQRRDELAMRAPVPRFLEHVWRENPDWDEEQRTVPHFGTERPRDMKLPLFTGDGSMQPARNRQGAPRTSDGSLAPPAVYQMLRRRNPLLDDD